MSVWTTKSLDREREYIVIKHVLNVNYRIKGVRFRDGYGVVEKNSKLYYELKQIPQLKKAPELPLTFLKKLPFITRSKDIELVYGRDVYNVYIKKMTEKLNKENAEKEAKYKAFHMSEESGKCKMPTTTPSGLCMNEALPNSPAGYCWKHIFKDPVVPKLGLNIPKRLANDEIKKWRDKIVTRLKYYKPEEEETKEQE